MFSLCLFLSFFLSFFTLFTLMSSTFLAAALFLLFLLFLLGAQPFLCATSTSSGGVVFHRDGLMEGFHVVAEPDLLLHHEVQQLEGVLLLQGRREQPQGI